ncbi:MAG: DUF4830 domain-containing protein [Oscillospiraceae bacterium]|nr:DUF4830 domain-containing protein [Oscillospiraceae bacterium]MDY6208175.1 DUF4830 domain-containing protein [Oscillospiraceae bacterium]
MSREYSDGRDTGRKKGKGIFLAVIFIILGGLAWFVLTAKDEAETEKQFTFECNAERVEFLNKCGLIVEPEPESKDIEIPAEFNNSYNEYNELQKSQGFDLLPYSGKKVTMYTYKILNYPDFPDNVTVNLLFDDHLMIGADITCNDAENGFTKPLIGETIQSGLSMAVTGDKSE